MVLAMDQTVAQASWASAGTITRDRIAYIVVCTAPMVVVLEALYMPVIGTGLVQWLQPNSMVV